MATVFGYIHFSLGKQKIADAYRKLASAVAELKSAYEAQ